MKRGVAALGLAALLAGGLTGCGGESVDHDKLKAELERYPYPPSASSGPSDKQVDCLASLLIKTGNKSDLNDFIDKKKRYSDLRLRDKKAFWKGKPKCFPYGSVFLLGKDWGRPPAGSG